MGREVRKCRFRRRKGLGGLGESDSVATEVVDGVVLAEEGVTV